jgi:SOS-response transcriptional repressor LexA
MKNISVSIDDDLYEATKFEAAKRQTSVSALVRELLAELNSESTSDNAKHIAALEKKHIQGYVNHPVTPDEFEVPESELVWGEA